MYMNVETKNLLKKLYNLKSDESVVIKNIDEKFNEAKDTNERSKKEKEDLVSKINKLKEEKDLLVNEGETFINALSNITDLKFDQILNKLNIDFEPSKLKDKVEKQLPAAVSGIETETKNTNNELNVVDNKIQEASTLMEELRIRKDEAISDQSKLNDYFNLVLNGNLNITREELSSLLSRFELEETEQREAAKLLMFPEDALFKYEESLKNEVDNDKKTFSEVFEEAKEQEVEETFNITDVLKDHNFEISNFTSNDLGFLEKKYNENIFNKNIKLLENLGIKKEMLVENIELFNDIELENKLSVLLEIGKVPFDIYLNPNVLVKYNFQELRNSISTLKESGLDPKQVPLMAF